MKAKSLLFTLSCFALFGGTGCSTAYAPSPVAPVSTAALVDSGAERTPPPGVTRQCWEEPKVIYEANGPGLDSEGKWYHPAYNAVRLAKGGRWVNCADLTDRQ